MKRILFQWAAAPLAVAGFLVGCSESKTDPKVPPSATGGPVEPSKQSVSKSGGGVKPEEEHGHKPGSHGGILVPIGRDNYHAEAMFEKGGILRLYILGQDESKVQEIETQSLLGYAKGEGEESVSFVLKPEPQPGDKPDTTSLFVGHLPKELAGRKLEVTIPSIRIGPDRFRISFKSSSDDGHADAAMPAKRIDDEERRLFLTAGGKYTAADVAANGGTTPSLKYKGIRPKHDTNPKSGDRICPISETKANPDFTWVVGGKTYEFCCIPCIEEFVALAKSKPDQIREPGDYVKK